MAADRIAIIGAGMAGLSCARRLADAGLEPVILDKGRGIGGRLATRRTADGYQFDHGAQYVTAETDGFRDLLAQMRAAGAADRWQDGTDRAHIVGVPGMTALAKHLAVGLDVYQSAEVTGIAQREKGWDVTIGTEVLPCSHVIMTVPAPQAAALLGSDHPLMAEIDAVRLLPCLTLMAALSANQPAPFVSRRNQEDPLAWIADNSSKPGRPGPACWIAQANAAWSAEHLEHDREEIARRMLPMLCDRLGADPGSVHYAAAHRWRYANVAVPLGRPFARDETYTLYLGGDWCLGARVEAAWISGTAIARDILDVLEAT